ncbi:hypothetical protein N7468_005189 [Penicillium chermesinum]|uniref:Myb-like domain-containing protein n=1 Tax=Penicillium chermesinum TaxID=63820 RepID=A0A9W9NYQ0_9EURO|nr:uncharacterized protein N7468_005189 [Penicillium chermesinum]KAJ5232233.1 hypothetical protein N7468_005189 [Penicillium chermesinum]
MSATLTDPYRGYVVTYSDANKPDGHDLIYDAQPLRDRFLNGLSYQPEAHPTSYGSQPQGILPLPEPHANNGHNEPQPGYSPLPQLLHPPHYSYDLATLPASRKRSRSDSEGEGSRDMDRSIGLRPPIQPMHMDGSASAPESDLLFPIHSDHSESHASSAHGFASPISLPLPLPLPIPQHHHHRLPPQALLLSGPHGPGSGSPSLQIGPPSVVGQPGMPEPAPRPKGPKLKFTPEEDALLVELKEDKNLTWKQIADFFPGRTSGTLQVRYCTKLKAKDVVWTDDMVGLSSSYSLVTSDNPNLFTVSSC